MYRVRRREGSVPPGEWQDEIVLSRRNDRIAKNGIRELSKLQLNRVVLGEEEFGK